MQAFSMWLNKRIAVDTDGSVKNVTVEQGVCEELALMLHKILSLKKAGIKSQTTFCQFSFSDLVPKRYES